MAGERSDTGLHVSVNVLPRCMPTVEKDKCGEAAAAKIARFAWSSIKDLDSGKDASAMPLYHPQDWCQRPWRSQ